MNTEYTERLKKIEDVLAETLPENISRIWIEKIAGPVGLDPGTDLYDNINKPALELINRGGKRWRPMLMQICCELEGGGDKALRMAPLVEFPHNGSLIVDDMEDRADWRRGAPAVHIIYGEDTAMNTGNFLYFLPSFLIDNSPYSNMIKLKLYQYYNENMRRLHLGQGFDIQWHREPEYFPGEEEYFQMCRFKTGSLSRFAAQTGILIGGKSLERAEIMGRVCEDMGTGFQILDDVINLTKGNPGKKRGDDIIEGKKSLPVILFKKSGSSSADILSGLFKRISGKTYQQSEDEIETVIGLLEESGSIEAAREKAVSILEDAGRRVAELYSPSESRSLFEWMLNGFMK